MNATIRGALMAGIGMAVAGGGAVFYEVYLGARQAHDRINLLEIEQARQHVQLRALEGQVDRLRGSVNILVSTDARGPR